METATIKFDMRNIITITLCGALGYALFVGVTKAVTAVKAQQG